MFYIILLVVLIIFFNIILLIRVNKIRKNISNKNNKLNSIPFSLSYIFFLLEICYEYLAIDNLIKKTAETYSKGKKEKWWIIDLSILIFFIIEILLFKNLKTEYNIFLLIFFWYRILIMFSGQWHYIFKNQYEHFKKPTILSLNRDETVEEPKIGKPISRTALISLFNYFEIIVIFSYFYSIYQSCIFFLKDKNIVEGFDYIYFSIITITTVGYGDYSPKNFEAKFLVCSEVILGFIIVIFFISSVISKINSEK